MSESLSGAERKKQLRDGTPTFGLFLNSHSPTVAEQLAHSGYDGRFLFGTSRVGESFCSRGSRW